MQGADSTNDATLENPRWVDALFSSTQWAWLWMMVRLWLGVRWFEAGWHKISDEAWTGGGAAVKGYWERAVAIPEQGRPPIAYDWYREFLELLLEAELHGLFGYLVAYGELLVGIGLIVGAFTGIAAFFGAVMNWNFMLAGTASTNPILGIVAIGVMVAWKTAGWWGADRIILPYVGAPWKRGRLLGGDVSVDDENGNDARRMEEWLRMLAAAVIAVYAFSVLEGWLQIVVAAAAVLLAAAGFGVAFVTRK